MDTKLRVLFVEDSEIEQKSLEEALGAGGCSVESARVDSASALATALASRPWDVIIAKYSLPRFSALAAIAEVKKHRLNLPLVVVSGAPDEELARYVMRSGAHDYITKREIGRLWPAVERALCEVAARRTYGTNGTAAGGTPMLLFSKMVALGELASGIAHEINNPLTVICGRAWQIKSLCAHGPVDRETIAAGADEIIEMGARITKLVRALNSFSRKSDDDPFEETVVKDLVDDAVTLCAHKFAAAEVELTVLIFPPDLAVSCRRCEIAQVLLNLLCNACDAVGGMPQKWVRLEAHSLGTTAAIRVIDSGQGIPKSIRPQLMEPFFTTKPVGKGTGLGLSISRAIIESHGGTIRLEVDSPHTTFVVELPTDRDKCDG